MKRELKIGALSLLLIALIGISIYLYSIGYLNFVIITATFSVINLLLYLLDQKKVFIIVKLNKY